jgi:hypothetical protein
MRQHDPARSFDREKARLVLRGAIEATSTARERLEEIAAWQELTAFVQSVFVQAGKIKRRADIGADKRQRKMSSDKILARDFKEHDSARGAPIRRCQ